ncbi:hypothetical protein HYY75_03710 [bacterium]|nr:hypothetical protein [bacterium]
MTRRKYGNPEMEIQPTSHLPLKFSNQGGLGAVDVTHQPEATEFLGV